jgi:hypothetical protein
VVVVVILIDAVVVKDFGSVNVSNMRVAYENRHRSGTSFALVVRRFR